MPGELSIIDTLIALFAEHGDQGYGEDVTQREHALQTAWLARQAGEPETMIAAALLHDVGQLLDHAGHAAQWEGRDARHEKGGAALLASHFPEEVVAPIRLHVAAKRYLCAVDLAYQDGLSDASRLSLRLQGGAFDSAEAAAFAAQPFAAAAVRLRRYDDGGKLPDCALPTIASYRPLLERVRWKATG